MLYVEDMLFINTKYVIIIKNDNSINQNYNKIDIHISMMIQRFEINKLIIFYLNMKNNKNNKRTWCHLKDIIWFFF